MTHGAAPAEPLAWMESGQAYLQGVLADWSDTALDGPTGLPDWTGRVLLAHLSANARALSRLAHWAGTGHETPMYQDPAQRNREIADTADRPPADLRATLTADHRALSDLLHELNADQWAAQVRTAQGRQVPATEIPWLRAREVWVHAADFDGSSYEAFPDGFLTRLIDEVVAKRRGSGEQIPDLLVDGSPQSAGSQNNDTISGSAADIARWLTGRGTSGLRRQHGAPELPPLRPWL